MIRNYVSRALLALSLVASASFVCMSSALADDLPRYRAIEVPLPATGPCDGTTFYQMNSRRLNSRGQLVGTGFCYAETGNPEIPFDAVGAFAYAWSFATGTYELVGRSGVSGNLQARDVNDRGDIVGWELLDSSIEPFTSAGPGSPELPTFPASDCALFSSSRIDDVDNRGTILGTVRKALPDGSCSSNWLLVNQAGTELLGPAGSPAQALTESGFASGIGLNQILRWNTKADAVTVLKAGDAANGSFVTLSNVNERGDVVGALDRRVDGRTVETTSYLWRIGGREQVLPTLGGLPIVVARDISDARVVVGSVSSAIEPEKSFPEISRAVAWIGGRAYDLTKRLRSQSRIQLTDAFSIDGFGRIAARGYRTDDTPLPCPTYVFDEATGQFIVSDDVCRSERAFLLVPVD